MTAWQDQPPLSSKGVGNKPLSRRQARENERGESTDGRVDVSNLSAEQPDFTGFPREGWDVQARREAPGAQDLTAAPSGRRSQRVLEPTEPLEYPTSGSPQAPTDDLEPLRLRPVSAVDNESSTAAAAYSVRDISPTGRRSFTATSAESGRLSAVDSEDIVYRTQNVIIPLVDAVADAPVVEVPAAERPVSRRELRAMEARNLALADTPEAATPVAELFAEPEQLVAESAWPLVEPPLVHPEQPVRRSRDRPLSTELDYRAADVAAESAAPIERSAPVSLSFGPANSFDGLTANSPEDSATWTPPTGHWSTQALIDDDEQIQENTLSRNIAMTSGAITTNALVIPVLPVDDMTRPLGSTGEILITGIIDLPRSYGTTGAVPSRYDHSDVDTFLEASDREDAEANPTSAPVRAIRAVNTHTSTLGAMETKTASGVSRLPLILGVVATTLAVGVVILVVAAVVFGVFK